jgi:hypothetical protein
MDRATWFTVEKERRRLLVDKCHFPNVRSDTYERSTNGGREDTKDRLEAMNAAT